MFRKAAAPPPTATSPLPINIAIPDPIVPALTGTMLYIVTRAEEAEQVPIVAWRVQGGTTMIPVTADSRLNNLIYMGVHVGVGFVVDDGHQAYQLLYRATRSRECHYDLNSTIRGFRNHIRGRDELLQQRTGNNLAYAYTDESGYIATVLPNTENNIAEEQLAAILKHHRINCDCTITVNALNYDVKDGVARRSY